MRKKIYTFSVNGDNRNIKNYNDKGFNGINNSTDAKQELLKEYEKQATVELTGLIVGLGGKWEVFK